MADLTFVDDDYLGSAGGKLCAEAAPIMPPPMMRTSQSCIGLRNGLN